MSRPDLMGASVTIVFSTNPELTGTIERSPSDTGDAWHIRANDGIMYLVQQYDFMRVNKWPELDKDNV